MYQGVRVIIIGGFLPLVLVMMVSLIVSFLQTATQIQDQSFSFLVRILSLVIVIIFLGPTVGRECLTFTTLLYQAM